MERRETVLWMREVLEHLNRCCDQWEVSGSRAEQMAIQSMERDLAELQRICRTARQVERDSRPSGEDSLQHARAA